MLHFIPILRVFFCQRIYAGVLQKCSSPLYLTPKQRVMETPKLACELVLTNFFRKFVLS